MKIQKINENDQLLVNNIKIGNRRFRKIRFWIKLILILILVGVVLVLLALSPFFNVIKIEVNGNLHYDAETYINAIEAGIGDNGFKFIGSSLSSILFLRYGRSELNILENYPYVKDVQVRFVIPDKVLIDVHERKPVVLVPYFGTYLVMDDEGYIVDAVKSPGDKKFPVAKGIGFESYEIGHALLVDDSKKLRRLMTLISQIDESDEDGEYKISDKVGFYDVNDVNNVLMTLEEEIVVNLGDLRDLRYRLDTLKQIMPVAIKSKKGLLDFTAGENPILIQE